MPFDFDRIINRAGTDCVKWDHHELKGEVESMIPMSIADMDFEAPGFIIDAIVERARHGVFGYTVAPDNYYANLSAWFGKRFGWRIEKEWIRFSPGVIPALGFAVQAFTEPGDKIIIQPPVYHPFRHAIANNGRTVVNNPLKCGHGRYVMDIEGLKKIIDTRTKMLILSNPHNPVGRAWSAEELGELVEVCAENDMIIISDEIHSDLIMKGNRHTPTASLSEDAARITVTCTSPSKTFNLAELHAANIIIPDRELYSRFDNALLKAGLDRPNVLGLYACEAAYANGEEWVTELVRYIHGNYIFLQKFLNEKLPRVKAAEMEGTYLAWLDFRSFAMTRAEIEDTLLRKARVAMTPGHIFGPGGEGFFRMNMACPKSVLEEALKRIAGALEGK